MARTVQSFVFLSESLASAMLCIGGVAAMEGAPLCSS
jgi:hypothetical protein